MSSNLLSFVALPDGQEAKVRRSGIEREGKAGEICSDLRITESEMLWCPASGLGTWKGLYVAT